VTLHSADAVIVGAGHNGLVAANVLAEHGWDVVVLEGAPRPGGAVQSAEVTAPGFLTDLFSAFYPMTAASPVMRDLALEDHGLRWTHAPKVLAHLRPEAPAVVLHRDPAATAAGLEEATAGDGEAWLQLHDSWERYGRAALDALLGPFPPVRAGLRLGWRARTELLELARMMVLPVRRLGEERFQGPSPSLLLAGNALHADVTPEAAPSAMLGWLLCGLGQTVGFPVPVGGAGQITDSLVRRLQAVGGEVLCDERVTRIEVTGGRASHVHTAGGTWHARHAVIAACDAQILFDRLLDHDDLPDAYLAGLRRFQRADATVKVNWALDAPVPWSDPVAAGAGTVHVADSLNELTMTSAEISTGLLPAKPFLLIGQMTTSDATRSPAGTESLWAYTHVPQDISGDAAGEIDGSGMLRDGSLDRFVERVQQRIEDHAPGFSSSVLQRHVQGPADLEGANASLVGGDISGGTTQMHQQLIFRPVPGLARPETPVRGLYLGSASAHPGGSVHGAGGANAAHAAIWRDRLRRAGTAVRSRVGTGR